MPTTYRSEASGAECRTPAPSAGRIDGRLFLGDQARNDQVRDACRHRARDRPVAEPSSARAATPAPHVPEQRRRDRTRPAEGLGTPASHPRHSRDSTPFYPLKRYEPKFGFIDGAVSQF